MLPDWTTAGERRFPVRPPESGSSNRHLSGGRAVRPLAISTAAVLLMSPLFADEAKTGGTEKLSADEQAVLDATNAERKAADLPLLKVNPKLMKMAREQSALMAKLDKLGHDLDGKAFRDRAKASGYAYSLVGENVGEGYKTPKAAVEGWMKSEPHRKNLLNKDFTEIGVAVATAENGTRYWTQDFGAPAGK
jgi:uncharacterized protein YkwD